MSTRIDEPEIERDDKGTPRAVRFAFGPHYFVQVQREGDKVDFAFGATHHGVHADASVLWQLVKTTVCVAWNESRTPWTAWATSVPDAVVAPDVRRTPPSST